MGGPVKVGLGVLVAALVAVLIVSATGGDDSDSPTTPTVAGGQPKSPASAKPGAGKEASKGSNSAGGGQSSSGSSAAPIEEEAAGFTESAGSEGQSGSDGSGGNGSKGNGGKVGGSGASQGSGKLGSAKKKKGSKPSSQATAGLDPEAAAASAVLESYMAARGAQDWSTACAKMTPKAISSLERFAAGGRGCAATFAAVYPFLEPGVWANTMSGPISSLGADGVAVYHGTTGKNYAMPMVKEGGGWKVAALGPTAVS
ncbi:MAG TPA: hypothetical protein VFX45_08310 [Solirubrobacterales bacterium]|nr:hypothetical protein [Solirubrobacterales bacterium]